MVVLSAQESVPRIAIQVVRNSRRCWPKYNSGEIKVEYNTGEIVGMSVFMIIMVLNWGHSSRKCNCCKTMVDENQVGTNISLSSDGSILAVGRPTADKTIGARSSYSSEGHVSIYQLNDGEWKQLGNDIEGVAWGESPLPLYNCFILKWVKNRYWGSE